MFGGDRASLRRVYSNAWAKHQQGQPLEPLEQQVVAVLQEHPEYHATLAAPGAELDRDYPLEAGSANPFLHLGLHLAVRDQVGLDRPPGIRRVFEALAAAMGTAHEAEHLAMEQLSQVLWEAQRSGVAPDEQRYLERLQHLALRRGQTL